MKIHIMGCNDAVLFVPKKPNYTIRISSRISRLPELRYSDLYRVVKCYEFQDVGSATYEETVRVHPFALRLDLAKEIISDFDFERGICQELLVHCQEGIGRSPAVAKALNETFRLGNQIRIVDYPLMNMHVYRTLKAAATELGFR